LNQAPPGSEELNASPHTPDRLPGVADRDLAVVAVELLEPGGPSCRRRPDVASEMLTGAVQLTPPSAELRYSRFASATTIVMLAITASILWLQYWLFVR
jgi:hypothetical protein